MPSHGSQYELWKMCKSISRTKTLIDSCADFIHFLKNLFAGSSSLRQSEIWRGLLMAWGGRMRVDGEGAEGLGGGAESRWRGAEGWPANSEGSHCPHFSRLPQSKFSSVAATKPSSVIQQPVNNFFTLFSLNMDLPSLLFTWGNCKPSCWPGCLFPPTQTLHALVKERPGQLLRWLPSKSCLKTADSV